MTNKKNERRKQGMMNYKSLWIDLMRYFRETKQSNWEKSQLEKVMTIRELAQVRKLPDKKE